VSKGKPDSSGWTGCRIKLVRGITAYARRIKKKMTEKTITKAQRFDQILEKIISITGILACALLLFSWLSVCTEVFFRYFLGRPLVWVVEVTEYILVQITFLASAWLLNREGHVSVDLLVSNLNEQLRAQFHLVSSIIGALICLILTYGGIVATWGAFQENFIIPKQLGMPKYLVMLVIPLGCFLLFCQFIRRFLNVWVKKQALPKKSNGE
jgi:TRAP-type C4-dicarboxylate transport system permease small subunit